MGRKNTIVIMVFLILSFLVSIFTKLYLIINIEYTPECTKVYYLFFKYLLCGMPQNPLVYILRAGSVSTPLILGNYPPHA